MAYSFKLFQIFLRKMLGTRYGSVGTRFSILGTRLGSVKRLKNPELFPTHFSTVGENFFRVAGPLPVTGLASTLQPSKPDLCNSTLCVILGGMQKIL